MDFAEAQKEALECRKCGPLCHSRTKVVFGEGPLNAELFVVGEAPGFNEDKKGKPFRGASGWTRRWWWLWGTWRAEL
jgi:DNA polymerase